MWTLKDMSEECMFLITGWNDALAGDTPITIEINGELYHIDKVTLHMGGRAGRGALVLVPGDKFK